MVRCSTVVKQPAQNTTCSFAIGCSASGPDAKKKSRLLTRPRASHCAIDLETKVRCFQENISIKWWFYHKNGGFTPFYPTCSFKFQTENWAFYEPGTSNMKFVATTLNHRARVHVGMRLLRLLKQQRLGMLGESGKQWGWCKNILNLERMI